MTSRKGNLNSVDLANIFQMLTVNQREGTLYTFEGASRQAIYFGWEDGDLAQTAFVPADKA